MSIWWSGIIATFALLLSIVMRFPLNIMIKFNESIGYVPLPKFFRKKKQLQNPKPIVLQKLVDLSVEKKAISPKKPRKSLEKKIKKRIPNSPMTPQGNAVSKKSLFVPNETSKPDVEEVHEKRPSVKKQDKTYDKAADILQRVVGKPTTDGEDSGNEAERVPNKRRSVNLTKLKRLPSKPAEQKNVIARSRAKSIRKTTIEPSNPVLNVSAASSSPPAGMRPKSRPQKRESITPQETKKINENDEQFEEEERNKKESFRARNKKLRRKAYSDVYQEEDEDELEEEDDEIGMDHLEMEKDEYPSGITKILKCMEYLPKHGFLCVANTPLLWLAICINIFVFICRTIQYVVLKSFFLLLGFIACTYWRFFWGLWDVYTQNFFYYEGLYISMIVGVLLLLPFDAMNLLSAPPCLPRMYETVCEISFLSFSKNNLTKSKKKNRLIAQV